MKPEDRMKFLSIQNDQNMAVVMSGEARGERDDPNIPDDEGRILVGSIVLNRANYGQAHQGWGKQYGNTIKTVIAAPNQFSCLNSNDPNYPLLVEIINDFSASLIKYTWLPKIYAGAQGLIAGTIERNVKGIYYETIKSHGLWDMFKERDGHDPEVEVQIGNHRVYKTV